MPTVTLEQAESREKGGPVGIVSQGNLYHNNININIIVLTKYIYNNKQRALTHLGPTQRYNGARNATVQQMASVLMHYI